MGWGLRGGGRSEGTSWSCRFLQSDPAVQSVRESCGRSGRIRANPSRQEIAGRFLTYTDAHTYISPHRINTQHPIIYSQVNPHRRERREKFPLMILRGSG